MLFHLHWVILSTIHKNLNTSIFPSLKHFFVYKTAPPFIRGFYAAIHKILDRLDCSDVVRPIQKSEFAEVTKSVDKILQLEHEYVTSVVIPM